MQPHCRVLLTAPIAGPNDLYQGVFITSPTASGKILPAFANDDILLSRADPFKNFTTYLIDHQG
jgi:hypothetical protein